MDHLRIREFFYMGYCIGGCFAGKLLQRAPDRVVAAVFCQTVGHRPEDPDVMYRHSHQAGTVHDGVGLELRAVGDAGRRSHVRQP
jgi:pimeloyl-ACP methyl ester carboxylesterase